MRKKARIFICIVLAAAITLSALIPAVWGGFFFSSASAKTAEQLQQELDESKRQREKLDSELSRTRSEKDSVLERKRKLDEQIVALESDISIISDEIAKKEAEIKAKEEEIEGLQKEIERTDELLKKRLRVMYEKGRATYLEVIFSASSFSDLLLRIDMVKRILEHDKNLISTLTERKNAVQEAKNEIEVQQKEKEKMRSMLARQKNEAETKREEGIRLITELELKEEEYKKAVEEKAREAERIRQELQRKREEQAVKRAAQSQAPPYTGGKLGWPCALRGQITSEFGNRIFRGVPNFHTGIDIAVPTGTAILAAEDGVVITSGWDNSYGMYITIDHGSIATLYAHNSKLLVSVGQQVKRGQTIALSGNTGNSTGPHLHFSVIDENGKYVNPRPYIF